MDSLRQTRERNLIEIVKKYNIDGEDAMLLQRISHRLHQLDENACNYGLSERQEKRVDRLKKQAHDIANKYGLNAYHQSDPRGWSLYLVPPDITPSRDYTQGLAICPH